MPLQQLRRKNIHGLDDEFNRVYSRIENIESRLVVSSSEPLVNTIYDDNGDIIEVTYLTGNKVIYNYTDRDLTSADYYHVDGITVLYRQNILYDANGNIVGTEWIEL